MKSWTEKWNDEVLTDNTQIPVCQQCENCVYQDRSTDWAWQKIMCAKYSVKPTQIIQDQKPCDFKQAVAKPMTAKALSPMKIGQVKRMQLVSSPCYFLPPCNEEDVKQHLTICCDGRVYLSRYQFFDELGERRENCKKEQFKISPNQANYILSLLGMYFEDAYEMIDACDIGLWDLKLINEKEETFRFQGVLMHDLYCRNESMSNLVREFTERNDLFCFDNCRREELAVGEGEHIFVQVYLKHYRRAYTYICDDKWIQEGDEVIVPFGEGNQQMKGEVIEVQVLKDCHAPYPAVKCKRVIKRV